MSENTTQKILHHLHIPWPDANESKLREAAAQWRRLGQIIDSTAAMANREAKAVLTSNRGPAISAFEDYWQAYGERGTGLMARLSQACEKMAKGCDDYAEAVAEAKHEIELAAVEVGATLAIGAVGAIVTFGAAEAAATSIAVYLANAATRVVQMLGSTVLTIGTDLAATGLYGGFNAALTEATLNSIRVGMGENLPGAKKELRTLGLGVVSGSVGGALGKASGAGANRIAEPFAQAAKLARSSNPELADALEGIAKSITDGPASKITQGVSAAAANQAISQQELNAKGLATALLKSSLSHGLAKSQNR